MCVSVCVCLCSFTPHRRQRRRGCTDVAGATRCDHVLNARASAASKNVLVHTYAAAHVQCALL